MLVGATQVAAPVDWWTRGVALAGFLVSLGTLIFAMISFHRVNGIKMTIKATRKEFLGEEIVELEVKNKGQPVTIAEVRRQEIGVAPPGWWNRLRPPPTLDRGALITPVNDTLRAVYRKERAALILRVPLDVRPGGGRWRFTVVTNERYCATSNPVDLPTTDDLARRQDTDSRT